MSRSYFEEGSLVGVLTPEPLDRVLDYRAPEGGCWLGAFVEVPLGPRKVLGVVWGEGKGITTSEDPGGEPGAGRAPMRDEMRDFLTKAGAYTLTPMSQMLRLATRVPGLSDPPSMRKVYRLGQGEPDRMTPARRKVIDTLVEYGGLGFTLSELSGLAGVSTSVIKGLAAQGVVEEADTPRDTPYLPLDPDRPGKDLTEDQAAAAEALRDAIRTSAYGTTLLKGVTGSGKTEVYLEAVAECLARGAAGAGPAAGDRADGGVPDTGGGAVRRETGGVAFRCDDDRAAALLEDAGAGGGATGGRRAVGAVPAVPGPRPDRRG
jgi:primosomal protein N' (replication factor Y)